MKRYKLKSALLALSLSLLIIAGLLPAVASAESVVGGNNPPVIGTDHPTQPGEVMLFQQAEPALGMVNAWDVSLRIEARDFQSFSDIVLVIDTSKAAGTRLDAAKTAAKYLVDKLLPSDITKIGVVSFDTKATVVQGLTNDATVLKTAIASLTTAKAQGAFYQAGIRTANILLRHGKMENSHIILFSGTLPTYSYEIPDDDVRREGYVFSSENDYYLTGTKYGSKDFGTTQVGDGAGVTQYIEYHNNRDCFYHHGNSAIAEAGVSKTAFFNVWSVALDANQDVKNILQGIASPSNFFTSTTAANLDSIVAGLISPSVSAVKNPQVSCSLEQGFDIPGDHIMMISTVPAYPKAAYNPYTRTITWNPGTLTTPITAGSSIKYAEMIYRIKIDKGIVDHTPVGNLYPISSETKLTYEDIDNLPHTLDFPIPKVNPILITVEKLLYDSDGNPVLKNNDPLNRLFTIEIKSLIKGDDGTPVYHRTFNLGGSEKIVLTDLWAGGTYIVEETGLINYDVTNPVGDLGDYKTTYLADGRMSNAFRVDQDGHDWSIQVKNEERHKGKITVYKAFDPTGSGSYDIPTETPPADAPKFGLKLTYPDGSSEDFTLKVGESKVFSDLPYGEYTVEETDSKGFEFIYSDTDGDLADGKVTLSFLDQEDEVTVINRPADNALTVDVDARLVWSGGPEADHTALPLYLEQDDNIMYPTPGYIVTPSGTASEFTYTWNDMWNYSVWGIPYTYTLAFDPTPDNYDRSVDKVTRTVTYTYQDELPPSGPTSGDPTQSHSSETNPTTMFPTQSGSSETTPTSGEPTQSSSSETTPTSGEPDHSSWSETTPTSSEPDHSSWSETTPTSAEPTQSSSSETTPTSGEPTQSSSSETTPTSAEPTQSSSSETTPTSAEPTQSSSSETTPTSAEPTQSSSSETTPTSAEPTQSSSSETTPTSAEPTQSSSSETTPTSAEPTQSSSSETTPTSAEPTQSSSSETTPTSVEPTQSSSSETTPTSGEPDHSSSSETTPTSAEPTQSSSSETTPTSAEPTQSSSSETTPTSAEPTQSSSSETTPTSAKPTQSSSSETTPTSAEPTQSSSSETTPTSAEPTQSSSSETTPTSAEPTQSSSSETTPTSVEPTQSSSSETTPTSAEPTQSSSSETTPTSAEPTQSSSSETTPTSAEPTQSSSSETTPTSAEPTQSSSSETTPTSAEPTQSSSSETTPTSAEPTQSSSSETTPTSAEPTQSSSSETTPTSDEPTQSSSSETTPTSAEPTQSSSSETTPTSADPTQSSSSETTPTSDEPTQSDEIRMIEQPPVWAKGSDAPASFTSSAEFADFLYVRLDGVVVDEANYDTEEGSTIITFKAKFLETLSEGKHSVEIVSTTGIARGMIDIKGPAAKPTEDETQPSVTDAETQPSETDTVPKTGTNSGTCPWLALLLLSTGGLLFVLRRKRMLSQKD